MAKEISGGGPKKLRSREKGNQGVGDSRSITFKIIVLYFILITFLYHFFLYIFHPRHLPRPSTTTHALYLLPTISDIRFRVRTKPQTATVNTHEGFCPRSMLQGHTLGAKLLRVYQRFHGYTSSSRAEFPPRKMLHDIKQVKYLGASSRGKLSELENAPSCVLTRAK